MDGLTLLRRARDAGLRVEASDDKLLIRGPKRAEPVVKLLAEHKAEVLAALAMPGAVALPYDDEPGSEHPCVTACHDDKSETLVGIDPFNGCLHRFGALCQARPGAEIFRLTSSSWVVGRIVIIVTATLRATVLFVAAHMMSVSD
jgi:hypothetical protein